MNVITPPTLSSSSDNVALRTSTSKLQQNIKKNYPSQQYLLETFFKENVDVLVEKILPRLHLEDIIRLGMVSKWCWNWMTSVGRVKVIETEKKIKSFQKIKMWVSCKLVSFKCRNLMMMNEDMKELPHELQELELGLDQMITNDGIKNLPKNLKKLRFLYGRNIANNGLMYLPRQLTHLSLEYNSIITDNGLKSLPSTLIYLNLSSNLNITDIGIKNLPRKLEYLKLRDNVVISNNGLRYLPPNIKSLDLHSASNISDEGIKHLPKTLVYLDLHNTRLITVDGIKSLPLERMKYLDLFFCKKIPHNYFKTIPTYLKHLSFGCSRVK